jgi:hypothetical protein
MDDLGRTKQPKHSIPVRGMGDIAGEQPHGWRQVERSTSGVHLRVEDVHDSDVVTVFDETVRERGPNESCPTSDEHGC